jgi:carbonic anhydrase/acetyltransferase-like protein (isoleucine patch superfamily)
MSGNILPYNGVSPKIHPEAFIAETAVIIGDVEIGAGSSVWYGCVVRGDVNRIRIGRNTNIQDGTIVHCNHDPAGDYRETGGGMPTFIGDDITIGHLALIHACTLESGCFVGMRAVIMDEAVVETGAMIAAGALVTPKKRVAAGQLWAGSPAKALRDLSEQEIAGFAYSAKNYAKLAKSYRTGATGR